MKKEQGEKNSTEENHRKETEVQKGWRCFAQSTACLGNSQGIYKEEAGCMDERSRMLGFGFWLYCVPHPSSIMRGHPLYAALLQRPTGS